VIGCPATLEAKRAKPRLPVFTALALGKSQRTFIIGGVMFSRFLQPLAEKCVQWLAEGREPDVVCYSG